MERTKTITMITLQVIIIILSYEILQIRGFSLNELQQSNNAQNTNYGRHQHHHSRNLVTESNSDRSYTRRDVDVIRTSNSNNNNNNNNLPLSQQDALSLDETEDEITGGEENSLHWEAICSRHEKLEDAGYDVTGNIHYIDVGQCRKSYVITNSDDEAEIGKHQKRSCNHSRVCEPRSITLERMHLLDGIKEMAVVDECHCVHSPHTCRRRKKKIRVHPYTPYETTIDVGVCEGPCTEEVTGQYCHSVRNKTVSIEGPNGSECISTIEECACVGSCYRMSQKEFFIQEEFNSTINATQEVVKEIDVGQCVGECSSRRQLQCVMWDSSDPKKCLTSLQLRQAQCVPAKFESHIVVVSAEARPKTVLSIKECACK